WLTVMAPAQMIEAKDLPPELAVETFVAEAVSVVPTRIAREPVALEPAPASNAATAPAAALAAPITAAPLAAAPHWLGGLEQEARSLLQSGDPQVWDTLTHKFEAQLIRTALEITRGRRIEAAQKLGIGRNTITRKIQELGLDD
ncbi:MAG: helix-turn-helix domain-containing protein, partial [Pseudomonadota bacterium]